MPGNYELYSPSKNELGPVICKACWENDEKTTTETLDTVWVSVGGRRMVWWLCNIHAEEVKAKMTGETRFLKIARGVLTNPGM